MAPYNKVSSSGEGSRPTTGGGVENIGAGKGFAPAGPGETGETNKPGPAEQMADKRSNAENSKNDDLDIANMRKDFEPKPNTQPGPPS